MYTKKCVCKGSVHTLNCICVYILKCVFVDVYLCGGTCVLWGTACVKVCVSVCVQTIHVQSLCSTLALAESGDLKGPARVLAEQGCAVAGYQCARLATKSWMLQTRG